MRLAGSRSLNKLAAMYSPTFHLFLWPHRLLFLGPAFDAQPHRHHAAQLALGLHDRLRVRGGQDQSWQEAAAFYVPPDVPHEFDAGDTPCALLYLDPEGRECEDACHRFGGGRIRLLDNQELPLATLQRLASGDGNPPDAEQACRELLGQGVSTLRRNLDPRLQRALTWLDEHLADELGNRAVAHAAGVSESWLSHHFGDRVGVPIRRYVLWRRLRLAIEAALGGASLTDAAHAAGFSDSAHLTRTFRETFGVAPSFLFGDRQAIRVHFIS